MPLEIPDIVDDWFGFDKGTPAPDYTQQRNDFRASKEAEYTTQANTFNQNVGDLNKRLSGVRDSLGPNSFAQNTNVSNLFNKTDDGSTRLNFGRNLFGDLSKRLRSIQSDHNALQRPTFNSTAESPWGTVNIENIPQLNNFNQFGFNTAQQNLSQQQNRFGTLETTHNIETDRNRDFNQSLLGNLNSLRRNVANYDISNINDINRAETSLGDLTTRRDGHTSRVALPDYSDFNSGASTLQQKIDALQSDHAAEQTRIKDYETSLYGLSDQQKAILDELDITGTSEAQSVIDTINNRVRDAGRFESPLNHDFSQEIADLGLTRDQAAKLLADNRAEQARRSQYETGSLSAANALRSETGDPASVHNLANLDALGRRIAAERSNISDFTSPLGPADFKSATTSLDTATTSLEARRAERAKLLDQLLKDIKAENTKTSSLAAHDEAGLQRAGSNLSVLGQNLSRFTGGRVSDINTQLSQGNRQISDRLDTISSTRSDLETKVADILSRLRGTEILNPEQLDTFRSEYDTQKDQIDLYRATQALDESAKTEQLLASERSRLSTDAANVAARQQKERDDILSTIGPQGVSRFAGQINPFAFTSRQRDDEYEGPLSSFAQNVIRV